MKKLCVLAVVATVLSTSVVAPAVARAAGVDPAAIVLTLAPGASSSLSVSVRTPVVPPRPDIVILGDTTGSMDPVLANVRTNVGALIDRVRASQPSARFGVAEYKEQRDGNRVFTIQTPLTDDADAVKAGVQSMINTVGGGGQPWTDFINAHFRLATDAMAYRPNGSRIVLWFGDAASHDPSLGHTLADTTNALRAADVRVVAVPTGGDGLDQLGQASAIVNATAGELMPVTTVDQVTDALSAGLERLAVPVTPQATCDDGVSVGFDTPSRTVRSGTDATFAATIGVAATTAPGTYDCTIDYEINNISDGLMQTVTVTVPGSAPVLSVSDVSVAEGNSGTTPATFTVSLDRPATAAVTVHAASSDGTATAPADYTATGVDLTFAPGETSKQVSVPVVGDTAEESDESFTLDLSAAAGATISDAHGVGTIRNDDGNSLPQLRVGDVTITEGDQGTKTALFLVSSDRFPTTSVSGRAVTSDGTATAPGDFTATDVDFTIPPGQQSVQIGVPIIADTLDETDETFTLTLTDIRNAGALDTQAVGTIVDDDEAVVVPAVSVNDATGVEGDAVTFTVSLDRATTVPVGVHFATVNGTATPGVDYAATSGDLVFAPGQVSKQLTVAGVEDTVDEPDETFSVSLSTPAAATVADGIGVGTITDDDRNGSFVCRASAVNLLGNEPAVANPAGTPCADSSRTVAVTTIGTALLGVRLGGGTVSTDQTPDDLVTTSPTDDDNATATTALSSTRIMALGTTIELGAITSRATARCVSSAASYAGNSTIASLRVNGITIPIGTGPVTVPLLVGNLKLNATTATPTGVVQRAVELRTVLGTVILGESRAGTQRNPCTA